MNKILNINDVYVNTKVVDELENINNRFDDTEAETSPTESHSDHQYHYSNDDYGIDNDRRDCHIWSGEYKSMFDTSHIERLRVLPEEIKDQFHLFDCNADYEITKHLSKSIIDLVPATSEINDKASKTNYYKSMEDDENRTLNLIDQYSPRLNDSSECQRNSFEVEYYPPTSMDYYFQEFNDGINQLTRWSVRMKELTSLDPKEFKTALESFRDQTGENPLRIWTVKANAVIGLMRDIQYDMESGNYGLD